MFKDRKDSGQKLARALEKYKDKNVLVLAIPRGGVEVGFEVARFLNADFSIIVTRKLPFPDEPEAGFGAIAEDGSTFFVEHAKAYMTENQINSIIYEQKQEIKRRIQVLRKGKPLPEIKNRTVILVDDGVAMGSTMRASVKLCRNRKASRIVVASPVSSMTFKNEIKKIVDEVVILETPVFFRAVAQVYENWRDIGNEEVIEIMEKWK
ncbi:MAG: phosphoribosyltransferase [Spirochaetes bacterium]|nr:phosphoribosyltransferase [Spirochaetota bacterium]